MTSKLLVSLLAVTSACLCQNPPFACNLKAFTPQERTHHRALSDRLMPAVLTAREEKDGFAFEVDPQRISFPEVAQWVDLERKCCPFFAFQLDLHQDAHIGLTLSGREGVKQFIRMEFIRLRDKLQHPEASASQ